MTRKRVAAGTAALALALVASTFDAAEAGRRGGWGGIGGGGHVVGRSFGGPRIGGTHFGGPRIVGRSFYGAPFRHGHRHRHFHRGFVGVPLFYGSYYYSGYGSCRWLRYRALETGSPYWWARYRDCVNGYY